MKTMNLCFFISFGTGRSDSVVSGWGGDEWISVMVVVGVFVVVVVVVVGEDLEEEAEDLAFGFDAFFAICVEDLTCAEARALARLALPFAVRTIVRLGVRGVCGQVYWGED